MGLAKYQLPPTSSDASKHVCGTPKSASALHAVRPLTPAPITHTDGISPMRRMLRPRTRQARCRHDITPRSQASHGCGRTP